MKKCLKSRSLRFITHTNLTVNCIEGKQVSVQVDLLQVDLISHIKKFFIASEASFNEATEQATITNQEKNLKDF